MSKWEYSPYKVRTFYLQIFFLSQDENVMVDTELNVKLIDFGSSQYDNCEATSVYCGSETFTSPQVAGERRYLRRPQDTWACGVLLYVIVTGVYPFENVVKAEEADLQFPERPELSQVSLNISSRGEFVSVTIKTCSPAELSYPPSS